MTQTEMVRETKHSPSRTSAWLRIAVLAGFALIALLTAFLTFVAVRDFVAAWQMTNLPGVTVLDATPAPDVSGVIPTVDLSAPLQPVGGPTPPPWDGANRVSLLVMGLDYRDWLAGEGPPRTDTMILLTIDPIHRIAGMLTIPRDLWVNIPGFDYGRINTAYQLGEAYKVPGGGPQLAVDTIEELLGVPVDYYAQVDFGAFVYFIDEIGGVQVEVTEVVPIDVLGDNQTGKKIRKLRPGIQTLPGDIALAYARARKSEGGDFDRAQRQQQVIMAIRSRILQFDMLPMLISKAPTLYNEVSSGIHTNLNLDQAIRLAWLASQIPEENIRRGAIGADQIAFAKSPDGTQDVLKPLTEKVRKLRDEIFTDTGPASPIAISMSLDELVKAEGARVSVKNGSSTAGLAARTSDYLISQGVNVVETGNAENYTTNTEIIFHTGKPYTVKFLVDLMKVSPFRIRHFFDPSNVADIEVVLGDDWALSNPMP